MLNNQPALLPFAVRAGRAVLLMGPVRIHTKRPKNKTGHLFAWE